MSFGRGAERSLYQGSVPAGRGGVRVGGGRAEGPAWPAWFRPGAPRALQRLAEMEEGW